MFCIENLILLDIRVVVQDMLHVPLKFGHENCIQCTEWCSILFLSWLASVDRGSQNTKVTFISWVESYAYFQSVPNGLNLQPLCCFCNDISLFRWQIST